MLQPAGNGRRRPRRPGSVPALVGSALVATVGGGVVLGVLWRVTAPLARAQVIDGGVYLNGHPELQAAQDGWLTILLALAGVFVATVQAVRAREPQPARAVLALVAVGLAGLLAWQVGGWLGPDSVRSQVAAGSTRPLTPLQLHTVAVLLVGPLLFAVTRCLSALFTSSEGHRD